MGSYSLTNEADLDLDSLYFYGLTTYGLQRADKYYNSLIASFQNIADAPLQFPTTSFHDGYRYSVHTPHTIYFRMIDADTVQIVRVLRGQDPRTEI